MPALTREEFVELLGAATKMSIEMAQDQVIDTLPQEIRWELVGFERTGKESSLNDIVAILYRDGQFPAVIDVTVKGVFDSFVIVRLIPSSHDFVNDIAATWNIPAGMGPFKPLGLMLPYPIWQRPRPLSLNDLKEATKGWPRE